MRAPDCLSLKAQRCHGRVGRRLAYYRREGLPDVLNGNYMVKRCRPAAGIAIELAAFDWTFALDWSDKEQDERARLAVRCVGLPALRRSVAPARSQCRNGGNYRSTRLSDQSARQGPPASG
jgi:hypothetical protein